MTEDRDGLMIEMDEWMIEAALWIQLIFMGSETSAGPLEDRCVHPGLSDTINDKWSHSIR